jgi:hypothetical protein
MYYDIDLQRLEECKEAYLNEDGQDVESESDLEESNEEEVDEDPFNDLPSTQEKENVNQENEASVEKEDVALTVEERQELRDELLRVIKERFLSGKDDLFDYSIVDNSSEYDDMDMDNMRLEDDYFDSEEPS